MTDEEKCRIDELSNYVEALATDVEKIEDGLHDLLFNLRLVVKKKLQEILEEPEAEEKE